MDEEFEQYRHDVLRYLSDWSQQQHRITWIEATRRADSKAREECAEIAKAHASCEGISESIEYAIRTTIKNE